MERFEALKLIQKDLGKIVNYLDNLKLALEPEFQKRDFTLFDVGVDIVETAVRGSLDYAIRVYDNGRNLSAHDILDDVRKVQPKYLGTVRVISRAVPYPTDSFMNLELLKDMQEAGE